MKKNYSQWPDTFSILIPAYKSAISLKTLLPALVEKIPPAQICIVDDGSEDGTDRVCKTHKVQYIKLRTNQGKGAALKTGFSHYLQNSHIRWILSMDADGQHSIDDLPVFIEASSRFPDAGIIIGARSISLRSMPPARIFSNIVTSGILTALCGRRIPDSQCGYRLYSTTLLNTISLVYNRFEMESEVILKACHAGFAVHSVPIKTLYTNNGSHISHIRDMGRWIKAVLKVWLSSQKEKRIGIEKKA